MHDPEPFNTSERYPAFVGSCTGPRQGYRHVERTSLIDEDELCLVKFQPKQRLITGLGGSPSNFFCVGNVPSEATGLICSLDGSGDVVHVGLDGFLVPPQARVGLNVPHTHAEHAHQEDAKQEGEDVPEFRGSSRVSLTRRRCFRPTPPVVTSNEANCNVNSMTSPLVCKPLLRCHRSVRHPSNVVCQQVQSTRIDRPVFACFKADAGVVNDGSPAYGSDHPRRTSYGGVEASSAVNHHSVKFQLSCARFAGNVGWRDGMVAANRGRARLGQRVERPRRV